MPRAIIVICTLVLIVLSAFLWFTGPRDYKKVTQGRTLGKINLSQPGSALETIEIIDDQRLEILIFIPQEDKKKKELAFSGKLHFSITDLSDHRDFEFDFDSKVLHRSQCDPEIPRYDYYELIKLPDIQVEKNIQPKDYKIKVEVLEADKTFNKGYKLILRLQPRDLYDAAAAADSSVTIGTLGVFGFGLFLLVVLFFPAIQKYDKKKFDDYDAKASNPS